LLQGEEKNLTAKSKPSNDQSNDVCATVDPGICGFPCLITTRKLDDRTVSLKISGSDCNQIQLLAERLRAISMPELFAPVSRNPVYIAAERSGCHTSCVIPAAVLKVVEVAMEMALARDVHITFETCPKVARNQT